MAAAKVTVETYLTSRLLGPFQGLHVPLELGDAVQREVSVSCNKDRRML